MIKPKFYSKPIITNYEFQEGERIETKVARIVGNNEPITDGAPIIYTKREDGVLPAYDIRTDRWEIAQQAMDAVHQQNIARSKDFGLKNNKEDEKADDLSGDSQQESAG